MSYTHKVTAAAAFIARRSGLSELLYRDAPVPEDAVNLDSLVEGGFVGPVDENEDYAGGHPSDVPAEDDKPRPRGSAKVKDEPVAEPTPVPATKPA